MGTADCPLDLVPVYGPLSVAVERLIANPQQVGTVIVGTTGLAPTEGVTYLRRLQSAGIRMLGYTFTRRPGRYSPATFGTRPLPDVKREINRAESLLGVDGIFVDNVASDRTRAPYYRAISQYIRSLKGRLVVFNGPGPPEYLQLADILVNFEGYYDSYLRWRPPAWVYTHPASDFAQIVHDVPGAAASRVALSLARRNHAGNVFITDARFPRAYARLPRFVRPTCSAGTPELRTPTRQR